MPATPDPYLLLGVSRHATPKEIRSAYRQLVARFHPDKHADNPLAELAHEKLAQLNQAYEILSDPARRARYDAGLAPEVSPRRTPPAGRKLWPLVVFVLASVVLLRFGAGVARLLLAEPWLLVLAGVLVVWALRRKKPRPGAKGPETPS